MRVPSNNQMKPEVGERWNTRSEIRHVVRVERHPHPARRKQYRVFVHIHYVGIETVIATWMSGHAWSHWVNTRRAWIDGKDPRAKDDRGDGPGHAVPQQPGTIDEAPPDGVGNDSVDRSRQLSRR